ncbi:MAG: cytochrome P450 [Pegethrix bostrychoides GSE-TBD4-15B]|jgi:cytochrome P450|uniref:Cytochrome P450 n=1 Tax=Pegethrix bostrychoides GSE-TBD4-15B TaxID=2839662 RepID=A0A951P8N9_9CYAN|nr:cytochrome P450 [Pegethrix bostrychoides GSE-TBD4-15B]
MSLPNGPKTPAVWQMFYWIIRPFSFMRSCTHDYGDCFTVMLGEKFAPVVFFSHPQALQTILTSDDSKMFDAPGELNGLFEPFLGTQSVIGLSGDRHRRMRQLMMPPFHGERMRSYGQIIGDITDDVIREWTVDKSFSVRESMQAVSMRTILGAVFGLAEGPRYQQLEKLLGTMLNEMSNPLSVSLLYFPILRQDLGSLSPWGNFVRKRQQIDQIIYEEISERRTQPNDSRNDILTLLMSARDEAGEPMTDVELRDELMTLLVAGHETTATALTWALYWIHKFPNVRQQLLQELEGMEVPLDPNALLRLPYLDAVCCETLRIYPVGMLTFPRVVRSSVELMGHSLEPETIVIGSIYLAHRRKDVYPDPEQFRPERFLERQFTPFEYLPFGGGSRRCIGMAFAQFEMKVVLSRILSQVELGLADTRSVQPVRRGLTSGVSPVQLVVKGYNPTKLSRRDYHDSLLN